MHVVFMKNFNFSAWNKLTARLISTSLDKKHLILDIIHVLFMKIVNLIVWKKLTFIKLISASWAQKQSIQAS